MSTVNPSLVVRLATPRHENLPVQVPTLPVVQVNSLSTVTQLTTNTSEINLSAMTFITGNELGELSHTHTHSVYVYIYAYIG